MTGLDIAIANLETCIDGFDLLGTLTVQNHLIKVLHQHFIELGQRQCPAVVLLHKLFHGQSLIGVVVAKQGGQFALIIKQQAVFLTPGQHVQAIAHSPQEIPAIDQRAELVFCQKFQFCQFAWIALSVLAQGYPADHLSIAQSARRALYVGFQVVFSIGVLVVATSLLTPLGPEEGITGPDFLRRYGLSEAI